MVRCKLCSTRSRPRSRTSRLESCARLVTSVTRSDLLPDMPTIAETVPGYELNAWFGAGTPTGTPSEIIQKLNQEINAGLAEARIRGRFAELGAETMPMTVAEFRKLVADEDRRWAE